jgi:hypothetical protein
MEKGERIKRREIKKQNSKNKRYDKKMTKKKKGGGK